MMGNGKLAVLMPTFRFDPTAQHCIRTVAAMASDDVDVLIGDNSENPEKWEFLHQLAAQNPNCQVYCHEKSTGGWNFSYLLERTNNEYIAPASDDDFFTPDYFLAGRDELVAHPECASAGGLFLFMTWHGQRLEMTMPRVHLEPTPVGRIMSYTNGLNALSYAVYRSSAMTKFDKYRTDRPFWPSYLDQLASYVMLCAGTFNLNAQRSMFIYNNVNWTPEKSLENDGRWFEGAKLPAAFTHLNRIAWSADVIHLFNSIYRPEHLSEEECQTIVAILFKHLFLGEFYYHLQHNGDAVGALFQHAPDKLELLREIVGTPCHDVHKFLNIFVDILRVFNVELGDKYRVFVDNSILPDRPRVGAPK